MHVERWGTSPVLRCLRSRALPVCHNVPCMAQTHLPTEATTYLAKAHDNLSVAELALRQSSLDACASRAYYAAFQAAVAALWVEGIRPPRDQTGTLSHAAVQIEWSGRLVYRRKIYAPELRSTLQFLYKLRIQADYWTRRTSQREARQACRDSRQLVEAVGQRLQPVAARDDHGSPTV
jgi:uncharacterized protein (UPF0332 family)